MAAKPKTYRGTFNTTKGRRIGLDFYADSDTLARDHAGYVAYDGGHDGEVRDQYGELTVVSVRRLARSEVFDAGSFYVVNEDGTPGRQVRPAKGGAK